MTKPPRPNIIFLAEARAAREAERKAAAQNADDEGGNDALDALAAELVALLDTGSLGDPDTAAAILITAALDTLIDAYGEDEGAETAYTLLDECINERDA
jgi:hypothetical protein